MISFPPRISDIMRMFGFPLFQIVKKAVHYEIANLIR
jgi:hypothetical protein